MAEEKKYSGYGYHGGGRKATGVKRVTINISGQPEQIARLKELAARENKTVSAFILEKTGVKMNNWFVVNDEGEIIGHDMSEAKAKALAEEMQEREPDAGLKEQLEKLLDFAAERTEMCDVCPLTETCRNSEGTCPYAALDEEKTTRKWLKQYIKGRK